eukprot:gene14170-15649_t
MTFFSMVKQPFLKIPSDNRIITSTFIDACSSIREFFDFLGSGFSKGKARVGGKITILKGAYDKDPEKFSTLQSMIEYEKEQGTTKKTDSATLAILMLKRSLEFFEAIFQELLTDEKDFGNCTRNAYERTLKKHHGWMVQKVFSLAIRGVPYRENLIKSLGKETTEEEVLKDMKAYLEMLSPNIKVVHEFLESIGEEETAKI